MVYVALLCLRNDIDAIIPRLLSIRLCLFLEYKPICSVGTVAKSVSM